MDGYGDVKKKNVNGAVVARAMKHIAHPAIFLKIRTEAQPLLGTMGREKHVVQRRDCMAAEEPCRRAGRGGIRTTLVLGAGHTRTAIETGKGSRMKPQARPTLSERRCDGCTSEGPTSVDN